MVSQKEHLQQASEVPLEDRAAGPKRDGERKAKDKQELDDLRAKV